MSRVAVALGWVRMHDRSADTTVVSWWKDLLYDTRGKYECEHR